MNLYCQFHNCGAPLTYGGKGQPPKYCPPCRLLYMREYSAMMYHKRNPQAGYKPRQEENPMTDPCPIFAALFEEYIDAGRTAFRTADEHDSPPAARRIRYARQAIIDHKELQCCRHLGDASTEGMKPRLVDPREFDTPPLLVAMGVA